MLMNMRHVGRTSTALFLLFLVLGLELYPNQALGEGATPDTSETVALWLFDEQVGIYPSCVLSDQSPTDIPLILGPGGQVVPGKYGNALEPLEQERVPVPDTSVPEGAVRFGLIPPERIDGRTAEPMTWRNAGFCALTTDGENHLRKEVQFKNPTHTRLNLGLFDWTVEFWFQGTRDTGEEGAVFEIGEGPRGENDHVTRLLLGDDRRSFALVNQPSGTQLSIPSNAACLRPDAESWHHLAFVYTAGDRQLRHFADGVLQPLPDTCTLEAVLDGDEAYFSIGRDGTWGRALGGRIDELRFSSAALYEMGFSTPGSFSPNVKRPPSELKKGLPLLFGPDSSERDVVALGGRKHVFIDDALIAESENISLTANPPLAAERVIGNLDARKHLTVIEDEQGLIRLYYPASGDRLALMTSKDGVNFEKPEINQGVPESEKNIVHFDETGVGSVFIDPNAPKSERWKYISGFDDRGIFIYSSADGWSFAREKTAVLPFRSGSQSIGFYDEQRRKYVTYHRSDIATQSSGATRREFIRVETEVLYRPWQFRPVLLQETLEVAKRKPLKPLHPHYLDNGPLTPAGFGLEYPIAFTPDEVHDPVGSNIYVPKALKYEWAPDTYLAFPTIYFNYHGDGPATRQILGEEDRGRGSGPSEVQLAVSRDGIDWKRYPRPTYVGIGRHHGQDDHEIYMVHGLVRRDEEIWQYYFGRTAYHSFFQEEW